MNSIHEREKINKFLMIIGIKFYLTTSQLGHIVNFMFSCLQMNFNGKMNDISNLLIDNKHRTSVSRFFTESPWNEDNVLRALQKYNINKICNISKNSGKSVNLIIDDTISTKTKPQSKAVKTIEGCQFHRSHTEKKTVYGHQIVVAILKCGKTTVPYYMTLYNKAVESKISIAIRIITELKGCVNIEYVLADSWYSSESIINASKQAGFTYVGALKTNRRIYPNSKKDGIQIAHYIRDLKRKSFNLVTVNKKKYYALRYCGKIKGQKEVVVIITYPQGAFGIKEALKAFVCTDISLTTTEILHKYSLRWPIEPYIRSCKMYLGLNGYQIRDIKGIKRYLILVMLTYTYVVDRNKKYNFSKNIKAAQKNIKHNIIEYIYTLCASNITLKEVYCLLNAS